MRLLVWPWRLIGLLVQNVLLALGQIWANKMRSVLTALGIIIGVASVTAVIAALAGMRTNVLGEFEALGTNKIFIAPDQPDEGRHRRASWRRIQFTPGLFNDLLEHCPSVEALTRRGTYSAKVRRAERVIEGLRVEAIEPSWHQIERRSVLIGRPFSLIDKDHARQVCLVNPNVRDKLRLDRNCVGQTILINARAFRIVGVVEPRIESSMFGGQADMMEVFVPFRTAYKLAPMAGMYAIATSRSPEASEDARAEIRFYMRSKRHLRPDDPDNFRIRVVEQFLKQFDRIAILITTVATGIVGVSLLVGGVGIMNIMLVSVSERTREIGLRKAVGATPAAILLQFLVEAVILCLIGGLLGVLGGQGLTLVLSRIPDIGLESAHIPVWAIQLSVGFSAMVGIVFGMFPAIKASALDPIEALRHE
jgi:putative ABC transport system permease protein